VRVRVCVCVLVSPVIPSEFKQIEIPSLRGSFYAFYRARMNWYSAAKYCQSRHPNAHLVVISSPDEQLGMADLIRGRRNSMSYRSVSRPFFDLLPKIAPRRWVVTPPLPNHAPTTICFHRNAHLFRVYTKL